MSMKSTLLTMAAMAMVGAQNPDSLYDFGGGYPMGKPAPKKKCDQKKCKSCKLFTPGAYKGSCPHRRIVDPWDVACAEHYKPKRKK